VRPRSVAILALGLALGLVVELATYEPSRGAALSAADFVVGALLLSCGATAWERRRESRVGALMVLAGVAWFAGNLAPALLFLHRGPLVHLHLSYPSGRLPTRLTRVVAGAAYVDAAVAPLARNDLATLALAAAVALTAVRVFAATSGPARTAGGPALASALAVAGVLALGAVERLAGWDAAREVLWLYDLVVGSAAVVLLVDLLRGRWSEAVVTGLVVDLGTAGDAASLRSTLARALGDPSLVVGYRLSPQGALVDDSGKEVALPAPGSGRVVTPIVERGREVAVLVHDDAVSTDRALLESVAAAARLALANARLQVEARARAAELEASRRRLVEAADAQRRRLEGQVRLGAERRLERVGRLLDAARVDGGPVDAVAALRADVDDARTELRQFAQGVHPAVLTDSGLSAALASLAARSPLPVEVVGTVGRLHEVDEAALFFVCSECLANAAKHASASRVSIRLREAAGSVVVAVTDDGGGGADPARGLGLRGLADRVEALGGRVSVDSEPGRGTRVEAVLPVRR
jgi:signal transduction histidine kinase